MKKFALVISSIALLTSALAYANPGAVVCVLAEQSDSSKTNLILHARLRIEETFSSPTATPKLIHFDESQTSWPFNLNPYGSTVFLPWKTCVVLGPKGQNIDVAAHELMHAELVHRIGYWRRMTLIPTWFDEGLAMQVDRRTRYDAPPFDSNIDVQQLNRAADFFVNNDQRLTHHYALAKQSVGQWVLAQNPQNVLEKLTAFNTAPSFEHWWRHPDGD